MPVIEVSLSLALSLATSEPRNLWGMMPTRFETEATCFETFHSDGSSPGPDILSPGSVPCASQPVSETPRVEMTHFDSMSLITCGTGSVA